MSHIICEKTAGTVIKSYSPNLMVHPYLYETNNKPKDMGIDDIVTRVCSLLDRVHVIVVGPGLGRDTLMLDTVSKVILEAKARNLPIVIDADGLFLVQNNPGIIKGYLNAVLTPNVMEFARLQNAVGLSSNSTVKDLAKSFGGVTILQKGQVDRISNGTSDVYNDLTGGLKRVSGQGDTLSGTLATFLAWKEAYNNKLWSHQGDLIESDLILLSCFGASCITRNACRKAFEHKGRAMLTSDITNHIGWSYTDLFGASRL